MARKTTIGQFLFNELLPEEYRGVDYDINKKSIGDLLTELAKRHPDKYREITKKMLNFGHFASEYSGSSISLSDLKQGPYLKQKMKQLRGKVQDLMDNPLLTEEVKNEKIQILVSKEIGKLRDEIFEEGVRKGNSFALQAQSGSRGNKNQLQQLILGDGLVADHRNKIISLPILQGYSDGLSPAEYFAAAYGARKGTVDTKLSVAKSGFFGKQLAQAAHRLTVTQKKCTCGFRSVDGNYDDSDDIGAVLAEDVGDYKQGTPIDAKMLKSFKSNNTKYRVLSPLTCGAKEGVCAMSAGIRSRGSLPEIGDNIGIPAAQSISEKLSQGMLSSKHTGGLATKTESEEEKRQEERTGFDYINRLIQTPKTFPNEAAVSTVDGVVNKILEAPQGGSYAYINGEKFYISPNHKPLIKEGDSVEAGDVLSDGIPNPAKIVEHKGVIEGRKHLLSVLREGLENTGSKTNRRNIELLVRGLINHVQITDPEGYAGYMPDEIARYDALASEWEPRENSQELNLESAKGKYLEQDVLDYGFGTRLTPRVVKSMKEKGINKLVVNDDPPPFKPVMVPAMQNISKDEDWMTRMYGSGLAKSFTNAVHTGKESKLHSTSFVPGLAEGSQFGDTLKQTGKY